MKELELGPAIGGGGGGIPEKGDAAAQPPGGGAFGGPRLDLSFFDFFFFLSFSSDEDEDEDEELDEEDVDDTDEMDLASDRSISPPRGIRIESSSGRNVTRIRLGAKNAEFHCATRT